MGHTKTSSSLKILLADTYSLYLKTQNYHWHVCGPYFQSLHGLFETQYRALAEFIDEIAERIRILGDKAPATFGAFEQLRTVSDGDADLPALKMVKDLHDDHDAILKTLAAGLVAAEQEKDEGSVALIDGQIAYYEKARWMLGETLA